MQTPSPSLTGFLPKKEACTIYNRSFRQLGRDFDKAAAKGDQSWLTNFKLRLEDGTVLDASEATKDKIQKLRDKGLNPTWLVRDAWMHKTYGSRSDEQQSTDDAKPQAETIAEPDPPAPTAQEQGSASQDLVQSKNDLIDVLREENGFLRESLHKERERSSEDKQLTRELHVLLKNMQDRLLPSPSAATPPTPVSPPVSARETQSAPITEAATKPVDGNQTPKPSPARKKQPTASKKTSAAKRSSVPSKSSKQKQPQKKQEKPASWAHKNLPTVMRAKRFLIG